MGGKALNQSQVKYDGLGYSTYLKNFNSIINKYEINESELIQEIKPFLLNTNYEDVHSNTVKLLKKNGVKNANLLMKNINKDKNDFKTKING